jgi:multidrug resistance protein, MATE family
MAAEINISDTTNLNHEGKLNESYLKGFGEVVSTAWPASLTMLNSTIINFVDGLMVASVGAMALNAQFIGGISSFVIEAFFIGMLEVVNTFVSQNYGAKRYGRTSQYVGAALSISWFAALLAAPLAIFCPAIFQTIVPDTLGGGELVAMQAMYFRYFVLTLGLRLSSMALSQFFFGVQRQRIVLLASTICMAVNIVANYVLIYGKFGAPQMGLEGAAIGSVIAFTIQAMIFAAIYLSHRFNEQYQTRRSWRFPLSCIWDLVRVGWPAGVQFFSDVACWFVMTGLIIGKYCGPMHLTASVVALRYMHMSFMPAVGISIATTSLVGKYIGQRRRDLVSRRVHQACVLAMLYMGACGLGFFLFREDLLRFFLNTSNSGENIEPIIAIGVNILAMAAVFQLTDAVAITYCGALRGTGDTRWQMIVSICTTWPILIGGGMLMIRMVPKWGSVGVWLMAACFILTFAIMVMLRFEAGKWKKIDLLKLDELSKTPHSEILPEA